MPLTLDLPLDPRVVDLADLLAVESRPFLVVEGAIEAFYFPEISEVDEGVADVAFIEEVYWKVEEVELVPELSVYGLQHLLFGVLIRDVPDHESSPSFGDYFFGVDFEAVVAPVPHQGSWDLGWLLLGAQGDLPRSLLFL